MKSCECSASHTRRRLVLTGGPGAGKTAVLELVRHSFCEHVRVLPESASILFGGGFPRGDSTGEREAEQRAIYRVQRELEAAADSKGNPAVVLCDRGTVDGLAYWPGRVDFWKQVGTSRGEELHRYDVVIHLRTPAAAGYNHVNPVRTESAEVAARIDERIFQAWEGHPRRFVVESAFDFLEKARRTVDILKGEMPECCRQHVVHFSATR